MVKKEAATMEDVSALEEKLSAWLESVQSQMGQLQEEIHKALVSYDELDKELGARVSTLEKSSEVTEKNAKMALGNSQALDVRVTKIEDGLTQLEIRRKELDRLVASVRESAEQNHKELEALHREGQESLVAHVQTSMLDMRKHTEGFAVEQTSVASRAAKSELEAQIAAVRDEIAKGLKAEEQRSSSALSTCNTTLADRISEVQKNIQDRMDSLSESSRADILATTNLLRSELKSAEASCKAQSISACAVVTENLKRTEVRLEGTLSKEHDEMISKYQENQQHWQDVTEVLRKTAREAEERLAGVLAETRANFRLVECEQDDIKGACAAINGIPTRQVEWRLLEDALSQLQLQLRLRQVAMLEAPATEAEHALAEANSVYESCFSPAFEVAGARHLQLELRVHSQGQELGDCSLYLWAGKGLQIVFRLFLGNESVVLRHQFDGKSPCGIKRIGMLSEQINRDGSLNIGIEVHEALLESPVGSRAVEDQNAGLRVETCRPIMGSLLAQQYHNHRLLELIQCQGRGLLDMLQHKVDLVRSRATRRVQWRLENASLLRHSFAEGQPICSTAFQAAGLSGLQLVFYPGGCAGARPGFCSFFLSCPAGSTVRCWLWAGRWRREARPEPSDKPDLLGRMNFCRFENCVDPIDSSIELALEIEEAQQASIAVSVSGSEGIHTASTYSKQALGNSAELTNSRLISLSTKEASASNGFDRTDLTTLKVQHSSQKTPADVVHQLPSIWTTHGFHSFGEIADPGSSRSAKDTHGARAHTCSPGTATNVSPPQSPALPRPGTTAGCSNSSRKSTPRMVSRQPRPLTETSPGAQKYKEYLKNPISPQTWC